MTRWLLWLMLVLTVLTGPIVIQATVNAPSQSAANRYTADGTTTVFPYTFQIYDQSTLWVTVNGVTKNLSTDYTVSGVNNSGGGAVTFYVAPLNATTVSILRNQPAQQLSLYTPNEPFPAKRIEKDLDKAIMTIQQLSEQMSRAVTLKPQSTMTGQFLDDPSTTGLFLRAKVGGGFDWATPVNSNLSNPVPVNQGGTGATTAASAATNLAVLPLAGGILTGPLQFTDNLYDIGASGAVRPRDLFVARNTVIGGTLAVTGTVNSPILATPSVTGLLDASAASAGQMKFPATQNASANANTLDDYEEGTWTPSLGGTEAFTSRTGTYTKIGRLVTVQCAMTINTIGTGSTSLISGLPYTVRNVTSVGAVSFTSLAASVVYLIAQANISTTQVRLNGLTAAGTGVSAIAVLGNGTILNFTIAYETD